jgi:hypothetical protein
MTPAKIFFQVARVLNLIYRLVVQPNAARAHMFAESFITCGGIETLLVLLQREAKAGDHSIPELVAKSEDSLPVQETELDIGNGTSERSQNDEQEKDLTSQDKDYEPEFLDSGGGGSPVTTSPGMEIERMSSVSENPSTKNLGGINLSISADNARNNVYNVDRSDGIVVAIIGLIGALVTSGHFNFVSHAPSDTASNFFGGGLHDGSGTMFDDKVSLLLFALQKAFQAAPNRLMTTTVYTALLAASVFFSSLIHSYECVHQGLVCFIENIYCHCKVKIHNCFLMVSNTNPCNSVLWLFRLTLLQQRKG